MSCGCINVLNQATGALRCIMKCQRHCQAALREQASGLDYYDKLIPAYAKGEEPPHVRELEEALGPIPRPSLRVGENKELDTVIEFGCGVSPYAGYLQALGYQYWGVDVNSVACARMNSLGFRAVCSDITRFGLPEPAQLILAAHVLEHVRSAPAVLTHMWSCLSFGGHLLLVLPDDRDLYNSEHFWFFKEESLRKAVTQAGFKVLKSATRSIIEKEDFLYLLATKLKEDVDASTTTGSASSGTGQGHLHRDETSSV